MHARVKYKTLINGHLKEVLIFCQSSLLFVYKIAQCQPLQITNKYLYFLDFKLYPVLEAIFSDREEELILVRGLVAGHQLEVPHRVDHTQLQRL